MARGRQEIILGDIVISGVATRVEYRPSSKKNGVYIETSGAYAQEAAKLIRGALYDATFKIRVDGFGESFTFEGTIFKVATLSDFGIRIIVYFPTEPQEPFIRLTDYIGYFGADKKELIFTFSTEPIVVDSYEIRKRGIRKSQWSRVQQEASDDGEGSS